MTRRKFVHVLIKTCSGVGIGTWWLAKKVTPRKFVRAVETRKYPGSVKPLRDISKPGKWSG